MINASCPNSTPRLKPSKDITFAFEANPISPSTPANPKPCNKPKAKAGIAGFAFCALASGQGLGGFTGGVALKRLLLDAEGVEYGA